MAIIYDLQMERLRRELAKVYELPLNKVIKVKDRRAFRVLAADGVFYDNMTIIVTNSDELLQFDGILKVEEIDKILEEFENE